MRAPCDGVVLPPPLLPAASGNRRQLHAWQGSPLDEQNSGSILEKGTLLCMVGPPDPLEAFVVVDPSDVNSWAKAKRSASRSMKPPARSWPARSWNWPIWT